MSRFNLEEWRAIEAERKQRLAERKAAVVKAMFGRASRKPSQPHTQETGEKDV